MERERFCPSIVAVSPDNTNKFAVYCVRVVDWESPIKRWVMWSSQAISRNNPAYARAFTVADRLAEMLNNATLSVAMADMDDAREPNDQPSALRALAAKFVEQIEEDGIRL